MLNKRGKQFKTGSYLVVCILMGIIGAMLAVGWVAAFEGPGVEIGPGHTRQAHIGDTILYNHTVTNTGTTTDTFTLEILSTQGWPVELVGATQPTGTLSLQVASQMAAPFQISLTVPMDAIGLTDTTIVTATSQLSPTVWNSAADMTTVVPHRIFFPCLRKRWPPIPYPAVLNPINNADGDGYYTVSWPPIQLADTHILEEDDNPGFSSPVMAYAGVGTSWSVPAPGKSSGTYYYRLRGQNQWGYGDYSSVQTVWVAPTFAVAHTNLMAGQCTTLRWDFTGIKGLHIVFGHGYDPEPVHGQDSRQVCPSVSTIYKAIVTNLNDSQDIYQVSVYVTGTGCGDPIIWDFAPTTYQAKPGELITISWHVKCAKAVWLNIGGAESPEVGQDHRQMAIYKDTSFKLKVQKADNSFVYASFTVDVQ